MLTQRRMQAAVEAKQQEHAAELALVEQVAGRCGHGRRRLDTVDMPAYMCMAKVGFTCNGRMWR